MTAPAFKFLQDIPISKNADGFYAFYHKNIAPALKQIIENDTCVHTIGLFGKWGTGKSTIVKLLKDDGIKDAKIVEFDCWKYEKDSLRRQLLLQIAKDLGLGRNYAKELEKEFYFSISEKIGEKLNISWGHVWRLLIHTSAFAGVIFYVAFTIYPDPFAHIKTLLSVSTALGIALATLADKFLAEDFKKIIMISPITATKNQMDSAERFEASFGKTIRKAGVKKVIIVIDNLDRVESKVATEVLSTLKTFLEIKADALDNKKVIFLVPCDFDAIKKAAPSAELAHEFLRKIFNIAIWTPEFISADIRGFIKSLIKEVGDISSLLNDDDVILVIESAFGNSPREIKQFLNNLVSSIVVSSNTEVKEIIEGNIPYLAKIQVLVQKYPEAYQALKQLWYAPETIINTYSFDIANAPREEQQFAETFRNFMLATSRITVSDAEPFIYFKKPAVNDALGNSEGIRLNLIEANETEARELIQKETDKNAVVEFILLLLNKYQGQPEILKNIFKTQLAILSDEKTTDKNYINSSTLLLDAKVWPYFKEFSTDIIFPFLLSADNLDKATREKVLERYVLTLDTEEFKGLQELDLLKSILSSLIKYQNLLTLEQKKKIGNAIEQFYINREDIVVLFLGKENVNVFITNKALQKFITTTDESNFDNRKDIIVRLKTLIVQRKLFPVIFDRFGNILSTVNAQFADYSDSKGKLLENFLNLILTFTDQLVLVSENVATDFGRLVIQTFQNTSGWDNKKFSLLVLIYLSHRTEQTLQSEISSLKLQFIQNSSVKVIGEVFKQCGEKYTQTTITGFLSELYGRISSDQEFGKLIYMSAGPEQRQSIVNYLISNSPSIAIDFISKLTPKDYSRTEVVKLFLEKAASIEAFERVEIYSFLSDKLNIKDDIAIKELAIQQIKDLLTQESDQVAKIGFDFLSTTSFLGDEKKREIAKTVLEFLRTPGKVITEQNRNSLKTLAALFDILQDTPKQDFVYSLFNSLKADRNIQSLEVILESLSDIKPEFSTYEKDYKDLLETLKSWSDESTRIIAVNSLLKLKPETSSKKVKEYWDEIEALLNKEDSEEKEVQ